MTNKFPNQNLDPGSQAWAREVESRLNQLSLGRSNDNTWQSMDNGAANATIARLSEQVRQLQNNAGALSGWGDWFMDAPPTTMVQLKPTRPEWARRVILSIQTTITTQLAGAGAGSVNGWADLTVDEVNVSSNRILSPSVVDIPATQSFVYSSDITGVIGSELDVKLSFRDIASGGINAALYAGMTVTTFWYPGN